MVRLIGRDLVGGGRTLGGVTYSLKPLNPDDAASVAAAHEINAAVTRHDVPDFPYSPTDYANGLRHPWPGQNPRYWLAQDGDHPVGILRLDFPSLENLDNAAVEINVHPDHRRRGAGRFLYEYAVEQVRAAGRKRILGIVVNALPDGPPRSDAGLRFAEAVGAKQALSETRRTLDFTATDPAEEAEELAKAWTHAEGYSIVRWAGTTPERYIDDVAMLDGRLLMDSPIGDLSIEPDKVDAQRVRDCDQVRFRRGRRSYDSAVRHDATDRLVAWTQISFDVDVTEHAWQNVTIVAPEHRGHRLGLIVKLDNHDHLRYTEPAVKWIHTWNATANRHMIGINERIGYRPVDEWIDVQHDL